MEMDVDAVLARRPRVALVDELAHTNAPGSRNGTRWQDVAELLDAGIDVLSTVNVAHLESLNDVVEKITGLPQRETVPDEVVRSAEQVELVDITPEALRRRMAHGNVYAADVPGRAGHGLYVYFVTAKGRKLVRGPHHFTKRELRQLRRERVRDEAVGPIPAIFPPTPEMPGANRAARRSSQCGSGMQSASVNARNSPRAASTPT